MPAKAYVRQRTEPVAGFSTYNTHAEGQKENRRVNIILNDPR